MTPQTRDGAATPSIDERKLELDQQRLRLESSFARKWLPTLTTVMIGLIASLFGYVQQQSSLQATERARIEAKSKDEREWGFKVVEMYLTKRELFDLTANSEIAAANLRVLAAVAPVAVQGLLNAETSRIPPPSSEVDERRRLESLAAVAGIQNAINAKEQAKPAATAGLQSSNFRVYIQFAEGSHEIAMRAQATLQQQGFRAPGIEQVRKVPSRLQIRYYRPEQHEFASDLAVSLGKSLQLPATADNAILVTSSKQLPDGILELWLPQPAAQ